MTGPQLITVHGAQLCLESFGADDDPAVLLIAGMASSMDWWESELCQRLASVGRRVVRYDLRDTGQSASWPAGAPTYTFDDLLADALGLLDALEIARAHVVGLSMGGAIAQLLTLDHPERVVTLTLMSTSPAVPVGQTLPPPTPEMSAHFAAPPPEPDWSDRAAVVEYSLGDLRACAGEFFDPGRLRALLGQIHDRTTDIAASLQNHQSLPEGAPRPPQTLAAIAVPTLIMHGTEDPLFPFGHAVALAAEIRGARLVPLPGVGHEFPPREVWDLVVPELTAHTGSADHEH